MEHAIAQQQVFLLHHICNVSSGFSKTFNFSLSQGAVNDSFLSELPTTNEAENDQLDIEKFLQNVSLSCQFQSLNFAHNELMYIFTNLLFSNASPHKNVSF